MPVWAVLKCKDCGKEFSDEYTGMCSMFLGAICEDDLPRCSICTSKQVKVIKVEAYVPGLDERRNKEEEGE